MVAGYERYFQIVRCFRDEDLRLDRQPEFTQIDVEMSFINQDDLFTMMEGFVFKAWKEILGIDLNERYPGGTFPRMTFDESMRKLRQRQARPALRHRAHRPDRAHGRARRRRHRHARAADQEVQGGRVPQGSARRDRQGAGGAGRGQLLAQGSRRAREVRAARWAPCGLARAKVGENGSWTQSPLGQDRHRRASALAVNAATGAKEGELILFQFGKTELVHTVMANLRVHIAKKLGAHPRQRHQGQRLELPVDRRSAAVRVRRPDQALGSGAPPLHAPARRVRGADREGSGQGALLPLRPGAQRLRDRRRLDPPARPRGAGSACSRRSASRTQEAREKFGFLLDALKLGAPPHGGIALGMDRLTMLLTQRREPARRDRVPEDAARERRDDGRAHAGERGAAARAQAARADRREVAAPRYISSAEA